MHMSISPMLLALATIVLIFGSHNLYVNYLIYARGRELWNLYFKIARTLKLKLREEFVFGKRWPELWGKFMGRRVCIHPLYLQGVMAMVKTRIELEVNTDKKILFLNKRYEKPGLGYREKIKLPAELKAMISATMSEGSVTLSPETKRSLRWIFKKPYVFALRTMNGVMILELTTWLKNPEVMRKFLKEMIVIAHGIEDGSAKNGLKFLEKPTHARRTLYTSLGLLSVASGLCISIIGLSIPNVGLAIFGALLAYLTFPMSLRNILLGRYLKAFT